MSDARSAEAAERAAPSLTGGPSRQVIGLVWAQTRSGVIGDKGTMPWNVPEDMAFFRERTRGHPVVMGRRTWESIPPRFRPLSERSNLVLTSHVDFSAPGARTARTLAEALETAETLPGGHLTWIIGGGQLYAHAQSQAHVALVTELDLEVDGDTRAPRLDETWRQVSADPGEGWHTSRTGVRYRFLEYRRAV